MSETVATVYQSIMKPGKSDITLVTNQQWTKDDLRFSC